MHNAPWRGGFPAVTTKFHADESPDFAGTARDFYRWMTPLLHLDVSNQRVQNLKLIDARVGLGTEPMRRPWLPLAGDERGRVQALVAKALATRPAQWQSQP